MGAFAVGTIVLVPFPFSDLSASKLRPAVILADAGRSDWICAQITSNPYSDSRAVSLAEADFSSGSLAKSMGSNSIDFSGCRSSLTPLIPAHQRIRFGRIQRVHQHGSLSDNRVRSETG